MEKLPLTPSIAAAFVRAGPPIAPEVKCANDPLAEPIYPELPEDFVQRIDEALQGQVTSAGRTSE
jgi:hypothetical protein